MAERIFLIENKLVDAFYIVIWIVLSDDREQKMEKREEGVK